MCVCDNEKRELERNRERENSKIKSSKKKQKKKLFISTKVVKTSCGFFAEAACLGSSVAIKLQQVKTNQINSTVKIFMSQIL